MAEKKDRGRKALDVGSTLVTAAGTLVDMGATGGALAGGKLLWDAVTTGISHRRRRQAEDYLGRLAEALGEERTAELAVELDRAGENEVWDTVEEGFRSMMGAINETAKRCIALLVADYVVRQELPDREFQLHGRLLASCDEPILNSLLVIARQYTEAYDAPSQDGPPSHESYKYSLVRGVNEMDQAEIWVTRQSSVDGKSSPRTDSAGETSPQNYQAVVRILELNEFGSVPATNGGAYHYSASAKRPHGGYYLLEVAGPGAQRFRRLYNYLRPALVES